MSLEAANREVYRLLKEGITVSVPDREHGGQQWWPKPNACAWSIGKQPENNDFLLVSQLTVTGPLYTCRPDLVGFVNGLPWVVIELKKPGVPARAAFDENLTHYKQQIPALFWSNALLIASNGTDSRVGSLTADWGRWVEWKRIECEDEAAPGVAGSDAARHLRAARLLDLVENFTLFSEHKAGLVKTSARTTSSSASITPLPRCWRRASWATDAAACSGRRRAAARAFRWSSSRRRC
jgi:type I restriction enzyme R subunit